MRFNEILRWTKRTREVLESRSSGQWRNGFNPLLHLTSWSIGLKSMIQIILSKQICIDYLNRKWSESQRSIDKSLPTVARRLKDNCVFLSNLMQWNNASFPLGHFNSR
jgi:hypothetical protein